MPMEYLPVPGDEASRHYKVAQRAAAGALRRPARLPGTAG